MDWGSLLVDSPAFLTNAALFIGRVAIGVCFVVHGLGKLGLVGTGNMAGFTDWLESLGVPMAPLQARMAMLSEISGGTALALGFLPRPACLLRHKGAGYLITNDPPGAEYTINLAVVCFLFLLLGPGAISLDALLF